MAGESLFQAAEGVGKKFHTWQRPVGGNNVEDEFTIPGEYPYASYLIVAIAVSTATGASHFLQVMAGGSLNVRIRRIRLRQRTAATTASTLAIELFRLSSAGTGGGAITPSKLDNSDAAAGASAMTLPTVKGTETTQLWEETTWMVATATAMPFGNGYEWVQLANSKPIIIPAGAANGIAIKSGGVAAGQVDIDVEIVETSYL